MDGDQQFQGLPGAPPVPDSYMPADLMGVTDLSAALKEIINDEVVENKVKDTALWAIISKSLKLTFLDENDAIIWRHRFQEEKIRFRAQIPEANYNKETAYLLFNLELIFMANIKRAVGTTQNRMNERMAQLSHFKYNTTITQAGGGPGVIGGVKNVFRRAFGR